MSQLRQSKRISARVAEDSGVYIDALGNFQSVSGLLPMRSKALHVQHSSQHTC